MTDDEPFTVRRLLHALTEDYVDLDRPVTVWAWDDNGQRIDMDVIGLHVTNHHQELELRRRGQQ